MIPFIDALVEANAQDLEAVTHDLMRGLEDLSGLDSVFLSRVDVAGDTFEILYARNARPERINLLAGSVMPWQDTMCRRAMAEGLRLTHAADTHWPELAALHTLRVCTYVLEPVLDDGQLLGTLCAVSDRRLPVSTDTRLAMQLVAQLLAPRMRHLRPASGAPRWQEVDALTGLLTRPALEQALAGALAHSPHRSPGVCLALVDVLGFDAFDAWHGHWAADQLLVELTRRLRAAARNDELLARYGDREFAVVQVLPAAVAGDLRPRADLRQRLTTAVAERFTLDRPPMDPSRVHVEVLTAWVGEPAASLLHRADIALRRARVA